MPSSSTRRRRRLSVHVERLGLAPRSIESEHELSAQSLAQCVLPDERVQLGHKLVLASEGQIGIDPRLERPHASLLEAGDFVLREVVVLEVRERRSTPEPERFPEHGRRVLWFPLVQPPPTLRGEPLEPFDIGVVLVERDRVAASVGDDDVGAQRLPKLSDVHPHRFGAGRRRPAAPELLGNALDGDGLAATEKQECEECPLLRRAEGDLAVSVYDLERSEEREEHAYSIAPLAEPVQRFTSPDSTCRRRVSLR
jgi:hypothetical protein